MQPLPFKTPDRLMLVHLLMPDREGSPGVFREDSETRRGARA
jgi:hypothetical protein